MEFVDANEGPIELGNENQLNSATELERDIKDLEAALLAKNEGNE